MMRLLRMACLLLVFLGCGCILAAPIQPGNLVVSVVGDNGRQSPLTSAATACYLREYTVTGQLVQTIALPTTGSLQFTLSGTSQAEGSIGLNGQFLTMIGYRAAVNTSTVARTAATTVPRAIAILKLDGTLDTSTAWTDAYSSDGSVNALPRHAITDGTRIWTTGTGTSWSGMRTGLRTASTSTAISTQPTRFLNSWAGKCWVTDVSGLCTLTSDWPTGSALATYAPGFPDLTEAEPSAHDFAFADAQTLYVADDRPASGTGGGSPGDNGIRKYTLNGSRWEFQYRLQLGLPLGGNGSSSGVRTFTVVPAANGQHTLLAVGIVNHGNAIMRCLDNGPLSSFSSLFSAEQNQAFRGIRWIPSAATNVVSGALNLGNGYLGTAPLLVSFQIVSGSGTLLQTSQISVLPTNGTASYTLPLLPAITGQIRVLAKARTHLTRKSGLLNVAPTMSGESVPAKRRRRR